MCVCVCVCVRVLQINNHFISWQHLVDLYHQHQGDNNLTSGLSILRKIKREHVHLTSYSKMRVDLAAQVIVSHCVVAITKYTLVRRS